MRQQEKTCSIPALKKLSGEWCKDAKSKADHLAETFKAKCKLEEAVCNNYTNIEIPVYRRQEVMAEVKEEVAGQIPDSLRSDRCYRARSVADQDTKGMRQMLGYAFV